MSIWRAITPACLSSRPYVATAVPSPHPCLAGQLRRIGHGLEMIYMATALDLPQWFLKAVDKIHRSFLWRGRKEANGGYCLIAWPKVSRPKELGGLGILDLQPFSWALKVRWLWLGKTEPVRPWTAFPVPVHTCAQSLFATAIITVVGNGENTKFWTDRWLNGCSIEVMPLTYLLVSPRGEPTRELFRKP